MYTVTEVEKNANPAFKIRIVESGKDVSYLYFKSNRHILCVSYCESGDFEKSNKI